MDIPTAADGAPSTSPFGSSAAARLAHWSLHALIRNHVFRRGAAPGAGCKDSSFGNLAALGLISNKKLPPVTPCCTNVSSVTPVVEVSSVAYLLFAMAHFLYSPLNPWPEILSERRNRPGGWGRSLRHATPRAQSPARFKLLSHKAEVLHPALRQSLRYEWLIMAPRKVVGLSILADDAAVELQNASHKCIQLPPAVFNIHAMVF